jgi:hypothetical protein
VLLPIARHIVTTAIHPITPPHIGELHNNPFRSEWKGSLFENIDKMLTTGTCSAPTMLCSNAPPGKAILRSHIVFCVKGGDTAHTYDLSACTHGLSMQEGIDFATSYSSIGSIGSITLIVALAASQNLQLFVLDISDAFQNSIIFDPLE